MPAQYIYIYMLDPDFVIYVPANGLALNIGSATPSAVLTTKSWVILSKFRLLLKIFNTTEQIVFFKMDKLWGRLVALLLLSDMALRWHLSYYKPENENVKNMKKLPLKNVACS